MGCDTWGSPGSPCPTSISLCDPGTSLPPARIEGDGLEATLIDNEIEASPGISKPLRLSSTWARGWAPLLFPLRHVMDAPFHFRFHSSQPGYGKAEPELGAVSGCRVLREVFFQNHLAEHPQILFCWCHALCALPRASILFPITPGAFLGCGVGTEGAFSSRQVPVSEFCCPQEKPWLDLPILL